MFVKNHTKLALALTAGFALSTAVSAAPIVDVTDFDKDASVITDGYGSGYGTPFSISGTGDTADGWTWYTEDSTVNTITVPVSGATVGEQVIRVGDPNLELRTNIFAMDWGTTNNVALRSGDYSVAAGGAMIDWNGPSPQADTDPAFANAYYSQDSGATWTAVDKGVEFAAAAGTLQFLIARNNGLDQNVRIDTVTVTHGIPEPGSLALLGLGGLLIARRR